VHYITSKLRADKEQGIKHLEVLEEEKSGEGQSLNIISHFKVSHVEPSSETNLVNTAKLSLKSLKQSENDMDCEQESPKVKVEDKES